MLASARLMAQTGPWNAYLQMALQIEAQSLQDNEVLAMHFGGVARVVELADAAWAWAAEHANSEAG